MPKYRDVTPQRIVMGRLAHDGDLIEELSAVCKAEGVKLGRLEAFGAVRKARVAFYDQEARTYDFFEIDEPLEILKVIGNVSLKDGEPIVHAHITLSKPDGQAVGGHLAPGTQVFACEFLLEILEGQPFTRGYDEPTGLPLWEGLG